VLLDLGLPDAQGLDSFMRLHAQVPSVPVIIVTGLNNESIAVEALRQGAQDYLLKGLDGRMLVRAITYAIERNRAEVELRNLLLIDELTGLYNRRGFVTFGEQYMKLSQRTNEGLILIFADLENFKHVKETFGSHESDLALIRTSKTLRDTFRKSDIIGHIGADYFAIMTMETSRDRIEIITKRLQDKLAAYNAQTTSRYKLMMSFGLAYFDPRADHAMTIEDLMTKADEALIAQRNSKFGR
jgi:diguanylate cyclase (GGDEF)-like protein